MKLSKILTLLFITLVISTGLIIFAGDIDTTDAPEATMYTLTDIYNLIHDNNTTPGAHTLSPSSAPTATSSYSISQLYADLTNLIDKGDLETGVTYLGITGDYDNPGNNSIEVIPSSLTPSGSAGDPIGYSLEDIYLLITTNATTTAGAHTDTPTTPPASSMDSLTDIYTELQSLASTKASSVATGTVYLGVTGTYIPTHIITFDINGGDAGIMDTQVIQEGATSTLSVNTFTFSGYDFTGWNTEANGSGDSYSDEAIYSMGSGDVTLYAQWEAPDPCAGTPDIGTVCTGGALYVGSYNANKYMTTPSNAPGSYQWSTENIVTTVTSTTDGAENTATLAGLAGVYPAADYCQGLISDGYDDWFLAAKEEVNGTLYVNRATLGMVGNYWTSTEVDNLYANFLYFIAGPQYTSDYKSLSESVRCVRKY